MNVVSPCAVCAPEFTGCVGWVLPAGADSQRLEAGTGNQVAGRVSDTGAVVLIQEDPARTLAYSRDVSFLHPPSSSSCIHSLGLL